MLLRDVGEVQRWWLMLKLVGNVLKWGDIFALVLKGSVRFLEKLVEMLRGGATAWF